MYSQDFKDIFSPRPTIVLKLQLYFNIDIFNLQRRACLTFLIKVKKKNKKNEVFKSDGGALKVLTYPARVSCPYKYAHFSTHCSHSFIPKQTTNQTPSPPWFAFALWWIRSGRCGGVGRRLEFAPCAAEEPA